MEFDSLRKYKLGTRLMVTFLSISVLTVLVGTMGLISMFSLEKDSDILERDMFEALSEKSVNGEFADAESGTVYTYSEEYANSMANNRDRFNIMVILLVFVMIVGLILSIIFAVRIKNTILNPIQNLSRIIQDIGATGNLRFNDYLVKCVIHDANYPDELGQFSKNFDLMMRSLMRNVDVLEVVAHGDLSQRVSLFGEKDTLGITVNTVVDNLSEMVREVRAAADQINIGVAQLSDGASTLAQSSSEQTSTVEQLNQAVSGIYERANQNAKRSQAASTLATDISGSAKDGRTQMDKMTKAMDDINSASRSISSVMKAIDGIAFQTNILSLNAAVEAARAGQQGRGFSVVADEVRSLATRSAAAAADSNVLIADTLNKSELGVAIVNETSGALGKIVDGVEDSASILNEIMDAAMAQNEAIDEVNRGINQLTNVVVQNSATAEESAAASEQMRSQTSLLINLVNRFVLDEDDRKPPVPDSVGSNSEFSVEPVDSPELVPEFEPVPAFFEDSKY